MCRATRFLKSLLCGNTGSRGARGGDGSSGVGDGRREKRWWSFMSGRASACAAEAQPQAVASVEHAPCHAPPCLCSLYSHIAEERHKHAIADSTESKDGPMLSTGEDEIAGENRSAQGEGNELRTNQMPAVLSGESPSSGNDNLDFSDIDQSSATADSEDDSLSDDDDNMIEIDIATGRVIEANGSRDPPAVEQSSSASCINRDCNGKEPKLYCGPMVSLDVGSLDQSAGEICSGIGGLTGYVEDAAAAVGVSGGLYARLERDIRCRDTTMNAMWDAGWVDWTCAEEDDDAVCQVQGMILSGLVDELVDELS